MGETMSRIQQRNPCINHDDHVHVPRFHFKCRFHKDDEYCETNVYTRTTDILRYPVPFEKTKWETILLDYKPFEFSSAKILKKDGATYKDPSL